MIIKRFDYILFFLLISFQQSHSQVNPYGLAIIETVTDYKKTIAADSSKKMIDLKKAVPGIVLDLKYSSRHNFMKQKLYPRIKTSYLRQNAAWALAQVQKELNVQNLGLKIWDAYRPYSVTVKMWEPVKDERYAANPKFGSGHNRGAAVDLTLVDLQTGSELDMGTGFDDFSDTAHHDFKNLPENILKNRLLLRSLMEKYGFKALETEWWHYYLPNSKEYELMNLGFKQLSKIKQ
ncbi:MAG: M15 family metallopeptidase [Ferruginibacter sp.]